MARKSPQTVTQNAILPLSQALSRHHFASIEPLLKRWHETGSLGPVLLLTGVPGIGKRSLVHAIAQALMCEQNPTRTVSSPSSMACGQCPSCVRAQSQTWIDFTEILPSGTEEGATGSLKIEQFRQLKESLGFGAMSGSHRITLIRDADRMTIAASNSLLKLLEEPPPGWIFFLTASDPSSLLPTLISRCQVLRLRPLTEAVLDEILTEKGINPSLRKSCIEVSQGSLGRALRASADEPATRRSQIARFFKAPETELNDLVEWAAQSDEHLTTLLDSLELTVREKLSREYNSDWITHAERIFRARATALTPVNKKLLAQDLLVPFLR